MAWRHSLAMHLLGALLCCAAFLISADAFASDRRHMDVRIAVGEENDQSRHIVDALKSRYPTARMHRQGSSPAPTEETIYIAVGPSALHALLAENTQGRIFAVFVSSRAYKTMVDESPAKHRDRVTAIFADPNPADQLRLVSLLYQRRVQVAVIVSDETSYLIPELTSAADKTGIDLSVHRFSAGDNLNRLLSRIDHASAVLAIPDSEIYNKDTIRNILITTYRSDQPLIGFSTSMVRAGALATTYSDIDDIVAQLAETIDQLDASGRVPDPQFPKYFNTVVNDNVARSLGILVDGRARGFSRKPEAESR